uniref:Uncharacterized protein n=1 Tax=Glossina pallidipes TaxID=7398 RepID=A0A1A9Z881_GLOPL
MNIKSAIVSPFIYRRQTDTKGTAAQNIILLNQKESALSLRQLELELRLRKIKFQTGLQLKFLHDKCRSLFASTRIPTIAGSRNADAVNADSVSAHAVSTDVRSANIVDVHENIVNAAETDAENDRAVKADVVTRRGGVLTRGMPKRGVPAGKCRRVECRRGKRRRGKCRRDSRNAIATSSDAMNADTVSVGAVNADDSRAIDSSTAKIVYKLERLKL